MLKILQVLTALFALIAALVQAYQSAEQIKNADPGGHRSFAAIDELATESRASRNALRWASRQREVWRLKQESPSEAR